MPSNEENELRYLPAVEQVLGMELVPPEIEDVSLAPDTIRGFIGSRVVGLIKQHFPKQITPDGIDLSRDALAQLQDSSQIRRLASELRISNEMLRNWHLPPEMPSGADIEHTPRAILQARSIGRIVQHAQQAPLRVREPDSPYQDARLTVAPPGFGKTVVQALTINFAGVGKPVSELHPQRMKAVGIIYGRDVVDQYLDPDGTLQRFINIGGRAVEVGAYYSYRHDGHDECDLLLTTPESYELALKKGAIDPAATLHVLDEAHLTAQAPKMQKHVASFGPNTFMFTATPAIAKGRRDLRRNFPHSEFGSLREFTEDEILAPIQLFTYRAGPEKGSAEQMAIKLAMGFVRSGRKTLVVCQPGNEVGQAKFISATLNRLYRDGQVPLHSRFENADPETIAGTISGQGVGPRHNLDSLRKGTQLIATTVAKGNHGIDIPDLDAVILIGPQGEVWRVDQWVGRINRYSGQIVVAAEILPHSIPRNKRLASIFHSYGMENDEITPGYYIGPSDETYRDALPLGLTRERKLTSPLPLPGLGRPTITSAQASATNNTASRRIGGAAAGGQSRFSPAFYQPPKELDLSLVRDISVREAMIAPSDILKAPPEDYRPLTVPEGIPERWLYSVLSSLDEPGIRYVRVSEQDPNGEERTIRYYSPETHEYLEAHPIEELAAEAEFIVIDMVSMLEVSRMRIMRIIDELKPTPLRVEGTSAIYSMEVFKRVKAEVDKIPRAVETDVPVVDLAREFSLSYVNDACTKQGISPIEKHRHPLWGQLGSCLHVTESEALAIRISHNTIERADGRWFMSVSDIARLSNTSMPNVLLKLRSLPPEQAPRTEWLRSKERIPGEHVRRPWGEAFAEYIKPEKVLPWEATLGMAAQYFDMKRPTIQSNLQRLGHEMTSITLEGFGGKQVIYSLAALIDFARQGNDPVKGAPRISEVMVALSESDIDDEARLIYSQRIQGYFLSPEHIVPLDQLRYYLDRRKNPPQLPDRRLSFGPQQRPTSPSVTPSRPAASRRSTTPRSPAKAAESGSAPPQTRAKASVPAEKPAFLEPKEPAESSESAKPAVPDSGIQENPLDDEEPARKLTDAVRAARAYTQRRPAPTAPKSEIAGVSRPPAQSNQATSAGYKINLSHYLETEKTFCAISSLVQMIAQRSGVPADHLAQTPDGTFWVSSEEEAKVISQGILRVPIATAATVADTYIAAQFSSTMVTLSGGDIYKIARFIAEELNAPMSDLAVPLRTSSTPTILTLHYHDYIATRIEQKLRILQTKNELGLIRRLNYEKLKAHMLGQGQGRR